MGGCFRRSPQLLIKQGNETELQELGLLTPFLTRDVNIFSESERFLTSFVSGLEEFRFKRKEQRLLRWKEMDDSLKIENETH